MLICLGRVLIANGLPRDCSQTCFWQRVLEVEDHIYKHWVQLKSHRLWFSTKTCSCYSTKTHIHSVICTLKSSNWIWPRWETYTWKCVWCSTKTTYNVYVSQRSQIIFEDEDHAVNISFRWVTTTLFSLRTTSCDALFVPSDKSRSDLQMQML